MGANIQNSDLPRPLVFLFDILEVIFYFIVGCVQAILPSNVLPQADYNGDVVLITGAGGGLGRKLAVLYAKRGAKLILWDLNQGMNEATKKLVEAEGGEAHCFHVDISEREAIYKNAEESIKIYGHVDMLINNAGIVTGKTFFECPDELMEKTMKVNTHSLFYLTKAILPQMIERDKGHIVTICSMAGKVGVKGLIDYCASKFGAVGFSESLRAELRSRSKNLHVTVVCPYYINTGMFSGVQSSSPHVLPILDVDYVAERIVEATATKQIVLYLPRFCYFTMILKEFFPTQAGEKIASMVGIHRELDGFYTKRQSQAVETN
ncbi:hypothetical protein M3Y97_00785800 [Aphelenchoides bicaudatus]|nr:hypothetical protein M3Y97_00785800 [Aphelenchoides bicaudatus]